jgi:hypothetical protein
VPVPGETIGVYTIRSYLGRGSQGDVYLVDKKGRGVWKKPFAVKFVPMVPWR